MSFFKSRLNWSMLIGVVVQVVLLATGKTEINEATATALAGNAVGLVLRWQDEGQKRDAKRKG